jgi:hypothetical protein
MTRRPRTRGRFLGPYGQLSVALAALALLFTLGRLFL